MNIEIERKFLMDEKKFKDFLNNPKKQTDVRVYKKLEIIQGYILKEKEKSIRIRCVFESGVPGFGIPHGDKNYLLETKTKIKGKTFSYKEESFCIIDTMFEHLLTFIPKEKIIKKTRHVLIMKDNTKFEVDFFRSPKKLVIAEAEVSKESKVLYIPPWLGKEVTGDPKYFNSNM